MPVTKILDSSTTAIVSVCELLIMVLVVWHECGRGVIAARGKSPQFRG
jgi:hypothetical protein